MSMLQIIISGTVMIIMSIAIRALAMDRVPKITFVMIWGIITARLLIPFSIPLPFNVWNVIHRLRILSNPTQDILSRVSSPANSVNEIVPMTTFSLDSQLETTVLQAQSNNGWIMSVIVGVWIAGVLISAVYFLVGHYKFRREIGDSLPVENEFVRSWLKANKWIRPIQVRQSHKISSPLTYGVFRPVILVPKVTDWQDVRQLNYIFTHEYIHIRRFDYAMKILFALTLCIHWFNPFVWIMYTLSNRDIELACDEAVLQHFGQKSKKLYALTLLNMEERRNQYSLLNNHFSKNFLEERIQVMMNMKGKSFFGTALALTLVAGTMTVLASSGESTSPEASIMKARNDYTMIRNTTRNITTLGEFFLTNEERIIAEYQEFFKRIGHTQTSNGISITIKDAFFDGETVYFTYSMKSDRDLGMHVGVLGSIDIEGTDGMAGSSKTDKIGKYHYSGWATATPFLENNERKEGFKERDKVEVEWNIRNIITEEEEINGDWSFSFTLNAINRVEP